MPVRDLPESRVLIRKSSLLSAVGMRAGVEDGNYF
jgi:hypothetical protein